MWQVTADVQDGIPDCGGTAELPCLGISGTIGNEDSIAGTLFPNAYLGYRGHFGGGKPPSPTVTPLKYSGPLTCSEQEAPCHLPVIQGGRKEVKASGGGGTVGEIGEGLSGLRGTIGNRDIFQVSGKGVEGGG